MVRAERYQMKFFKKRKEESALERRLDVISNLTKGLGKTEFNNLMAAAEAMYEARQKLKKVKTDDEKELEDVDEIDHKLELIKEKK